MTYEKAFKQLIKTIEHMKIDYQNLKPASDILTMEKCYLLDHVLTHGRLLGSMIDEPSKEEPDTLKLLKSMYDE